MRLGHVNSLREWFTKKILDSDYHEADFYDSHDVIDSDNDYEEEDDAV